MIRYARLVLNLLVTSWVLLAIGCAGTQGTSSRIHGTPTRQVQSDSGTTHTGVVTHIDKETVTIECKVHGKSETFYVDPENPAMAEVFSLGYIKTGDTVGMVAVGDRIRSMRSEGVR